MLKKHFFWPMLFVLLLFSSQGLHAAVGDKTTNSQSWSNGQLENTIKDGKSVMTTSDNFATFTLAGAEQISFTSTIDISWGGSDDRLKLFEKCAAGQQQDLSFTWEPVSTGYTLVVKQIRTLSAMAGSFGYYKLGSASEVEIAKAAGATSSALDSSFQWADWPAKAPDCKEF